jgi:hypothetical protein
MSSEQKTTVVSLFDSHQPRNNSTHKAQRARLYFLKLSEKINLHSLFLISLFVFALLIRLVFLTVIYQDRLASTKSLRWLEARS